MGINHHSLRFQRKESNSPTTPKFDIMVLMKDFIVPPQEKMACAK
jgi:hypothetical protein